MTANIQIKNRAHHAPRKKTIHEEPSSISRAHFQLYEIAIRMGKTDLSLDFIDNAVQTALQYEGVADLMHLWNEESDRKEQDEIIADIQEMIEACSQEKVIEEVYIKFNDLDAVAKDIRGFKDSLYQKVMEFGGVGELAEQTGIPQPSLSRFFNSNSIPRRATLLKIAKVLGLDRVKMDVRWSK